MDADKTQLMKTEIETALKATEKGYSRKANELLSSYGRGLEGTKAWEYPLAFALIEMMKAAFVTQEPSFILNPLNDEGKAIAPVWEKLLNHFAHTLDLRVRAEEAADWATITGFAVAKVGYYDEEKSALIGETESNVIGKLFVSVPDPRYFFVDPYCKKSDLSDARYCGDVSNLPKADLEQSILYDPKVVTKLKSDQVGTLFPEGSRQNPRQGSKLPDEYGLCQIREIHIRNRYSRQIEIAAFDDGGALLRELTPMPEEFTLYNYVPLVLFPIPGWFYGFSILSKVEKICDMIDSAMKRISNRWAHNPEKFAAQLTQMMGTTEKAFTSSALFNVVDTGDIPADGAFTEVRGQVINQDEMAYLRMLVELFQWISGMSYMELGRGSSRTATEASFVGRAGDMRSARRMNVMERWVSTIGKRILTICRAELNSTPEGTETNIPFEEILGKEDLETWIAYEAAQSEREKTKMDTDVTVRMSLPVNVAAIHRRDKSLEFLRSVGNEGVLALLQAQGKMIDMAGLIESIASDTGLSGNFISDLPQGTKLVEDKGEEGMGA